VNKAWLYEMRRRTWEAAIRVVERAGDKAHEGDVASIKAVCTKLANQLREAAHEDELGVRR
jgi:hypothetical protein